MNKTAFKIAASSVIVAMTMVACSSQSDAMRRLGSPSRDVPADQQARLLNEQARVSLQRGNVAQALAQIEQAVELSPRDIGYRLFLADLYLKSGRFDSARATFADVLELDPQHVRASLSLALTQIALGRPQAAVAQLDNVVGRASASDVGLAYALAGMPERAIEILEPAARNFDASPRLRQYLALSYALAGDWQRARTVAAQDISPAELGQRLEQWASLARPDAGSTRVASLLGVTPVQDPGQPTRLALSQPAPATPAQAETVAFAEAAPVEAPVPQSDWGLAPSEAPAPAPVAIAEASVPQSTAPSYYTPAPEAPPAPPSEQEVRFAAAAQTLTQPEPAVVRTAAVSLPPAPVFERERPSRPAEVGSGKSRFVVQLGAFSTQQNAERAWQQAERRYGLSGRAPLTATIAMNGRTLHRVAVAGFASQSAANRLCSSIRSQGGACFVRINAGDASVRWAARYAQGRDRSA